MTFQPKTREEIALQNALPDGWYPFEVRVAEEKVSKNGNEMIKLGLTVYAGDREFWIDDYLMSGDFGIAKIMAFCESCGLMSDYDAGTVSAEKCDGKSGWCRVGIQKSGDFAGKNTIKNYSDKNPKADGSPAPTRPSAPARQPKEAFPPGMNDDDIPF